MPIVPNTYVADPSHQQPIPTHPDGRYYRFEVISSDGGSRIYEDSFEAVTDILIPGYAQSSPQEQTVKRIRFAYDRAVILQAQLLGEQEDNESFPTPEEQALLRRTRDTPTLITQWKSVIPLVLVTTEYAPTTTIPRPQGNIVWLDPVSDESLMRSLDDAGVIILYELASETDEQEPQERQKSQEQHLIASYSPYNDLTVTGIKYTSEAIEVWVQGRLVASAEPIPYSTTAPWFAEAFPSITHWYGVSPWTGRIKARITETHFNKIVGTIQYTDDDSFLYEWSMMLDKDADSSTLRVPMPPFETERNIELLMVLTQYLLGVIGGDMADEWLVVSSVIQRENLNRVVEMYANDTNLIIIPVITIDAFEVQETPPLQASTLSFSSPAQ